jgi:hypothetical protein
VFVVLRIVSAPPNAKHAEVLGHETLLSHCVVPEVFLVQLTPFVATRIVPASPTMVQINVVEQETLERALAVPVP